MDHEILVTIRDAFRSKYLLSEDEAIIVTDEDLEIYIDDHIFRIHVEDDVNG